jgi:hypothetical protein
MTRATEVEPETFTSLANVGTENSDVDKSAANATRTIINSPLIDATGYN